MSIFCKWIVCHGLFWCKTLQIILSPGNYRSRSGTSYTTKYSPWMPEMPSKSDSAIFWRATGKCRTTLPSMLYSSEVYYQQLLFDLQILIQPFWIFIIVWFNSSTTKTVLVVFDLLIPVNTCNRLPLLINLTASVFFSLNSTGSFPWINRSFAFRYDSYRSMKRLVFFL